jgi:hypothetical protein
MPWKINNFDRSDKVVGNPAAGAKILVVSKCLWGLNNP